MILKGVVEYSVSIFIMGEWVSLGHMVVRSRWGNGGGGWDDKKVIVEETF